MRSGCPKEKFSLWVFSKFDLRPTESFCTYGGIRLERIRKAKRGATLPVDRWSCKLGVPSVWGLFWINI